MNPIPYGRQSISQEDIDAVVETLRSDFLTQGPAVAAFEKAFSDYIGAKYAVAVSNGTTALHLCALALNVRPGDKVITTPITFVASANCIRYCGGDVVFSDIDPATFLLDVGKVRQLLEKHPKGTFKGIIPVDFSGASVDLEVFRKLADEYGMWIIEDACHAPGGYFTDSRSKKQNCGNGNYAELAIFSFHPVKHIATGEGGMITTNDKALYDKLCLLRTHGISKDPSRLKENHGGWYHEMQELGYNYRLSDIQAALGVSQMKRAWEGLKKRREIAAKYDNAFGKSGLDIITPARTDGHAYHLYVIQVNDRKGLYEHLRKNNIFSQVHYIPAHTMPYYRFLGYKKGDFPASESYYQGCLSLPMYPTLSQKEQDYVIHKILEFFENRTYARNITKVIF
ncbi:MAG: UDP-4-amino-4,6-dideoxy-N-acetyl-beta-L-altrosamine transaminase [Bacteroidetes bacterium]|nr:MAG: UDP-4-amino-4,6-dideoxy-N-acetyl-beta-L-altrosamine transaminase [Bacteroidota bacterium]